MVICIVYLIKTAFYISDCMQAPTLKIGPYFVILTESARAAGRALIISGICDAVQPENKSLQSKTNYPTLGAKNTKTRLFIIRNCLQYSIKRGQFSLFNTKIVSKIYRFVWYFSSDEHISFQCLKLTGSRDRSQIFGQN